MPDGLTLTYTAGAGVGERRRVRIEPRSDGYWDRVEEYHNGCRWVPRGHEIVADVDVEGATDGAAVLTRGP